MTPEKGEKPLAAQGDTNARAVPADRPDWINDPWYDLRPEQAWRAGWEAARKQIADGLRAQSDWHRAAQQTPIRFPTGKEVPRLTNTHDMWADALGGAATAIAAMDPPA